MNDPILNPSRRGFLTGAALMAMLAAAGPARKAVAQVRSSARIVIAGAGAAGLTAAAQLSRRLDGAAITLVDARRRHLYQPGFTLVAANLKPADYVVSATERWVPQGVTLVEQEIAEFDPDASRVVLASGQALDYDFLVLATGLALDYDAIEGFDRALIGRNGLGSIYAGPEEAAATGAEMARFAARGGTGLFLRPATEMKCAGAPLKYAFIADDVLRRNGMRGSADLIYCAHNKSLFGVPIVAEKVRMLYADRGIAVRHERVLTAIDPARRIATFRTPEGSEDIGYDFVNVVPPMRAPQAVRQSALAWAEGPLAADGWAETDRATLRHRRFANVFCVGDVAGVPKGKTAASVKWQVPVAVDHMVADIAGGSSTEAYDGYTSCPLITRIGRAMLVEFDYNDNLVPSFPGVIAPLEELWVTWLMKEVALKPTYLAMIRGQA